jgi:hypothetical protein
MSIFLYRFIPTSHLQFNFDNKLKQVCSRNSLSWQIWWWITQLSHTFFFGRKFLQHRPENVSVSTIESSTEERTTGMSSWHFSLLRFPWNYKGHDTIYTAVILCNQISRSEACDLHHVWCWNMGRQVHGKSLWFLYLMSGQIMIDLSTEKTLTSVATQHCLSYLNKTVT